MVGAPHPHVTLLTLRACVGAVLSVLFFYILRSCGGALIRVSLYASLVVQVGQPSFLLYDCGIVPCILLSLMHGNRRVARTTHSDADAASYPNRRLSLAVVSSL